MYALVIDGAVVMYPYSLAQLYADNPQVSFPANPSNETLAEFGVFTCAQTQKPIIDHTKNIAQSFEKINGVWTRTWIVTDASAEEIQNRIAAQWETVREQRNLLLAQSDWTQLADAPVDPFPWITYREELRDITLQADPFNLTWPVAP